jgi:hypothetical protein
VSAFAQQAVQQAAAMPDARTLVVPRSAHDGINIARRRFVGAIAPFFL